jgi:quercetin dioxygenase-like cupin family protein
MQAPPDPSNIAGPASPPRTLIIPPEGGQKISAYSDTAQIKLSGKQTNGSMVVALGTSPPGGGPPPHRHLKEDEMPLVVEGSIRFFANGQWKTQSRWKNCLFPSPT